MTQHETTWVRGSVVFLALGLGLGLLVGMAVAPRSGADVRRLVAHYVQGASGMLGIPGQAREELAEDMSY